MKVLTRCQPLTIEVGNLTVDTLNEILVHVLQRRSDDNSVLELTKVIHRKSQGNVFFAKQVLTLLQRKMLVFFSLHSYQWEWNLADVIGDTSLSDNAIAIVIEKLQDLPPPSRRAVMVACIGSWFDKTLLLNLLAANVLGLPKLTLTLNETPDFKLLEESDVICHRQDTHDQVQQAAYSLFHSEVHREKTHFAIGQFLLRPSTVDDPLKQLLATDQLNHGAYALQDDVDRFMIMNNNHEAALVAVKKSAFVQAERFHSIAIQVFPKEVLWLEYYDLAIAMSSTWAETLLTLGKFDKVECVVNEVLHHAMRHSDTCRVLSVMLCCLSSMNRLKEASAFGYRHLRKVLKLSRKPGNFHVLREVFRVRRWLKKVPIEKLLLADECDGVDFGYQFLLARLADNAFLRDDEESSLYFSMKNLNLAFVQGPSKCTAVGLAVYGIFLGITGDFDGAYEVSKWVSAMAGRFKSRVFHFQDYITAIGFLSYLRQPLQELLDASLECHRAAMRVGDKVHACVCIQVYFYMYFLCGLKLSPLTSDVRRHRATFVEQNECASVRCMIDTIGQFALNLTGESSHSFEIDGEFFPRNNFMEAIVNDARHGLAWLFHWSVYLYLSYILDPSSAHVRQSFAKLYLGKRGLTKFMDGTTNFSGPPFCMGFCLAAIALERDSGKHIFSKRRRTLTKVVKKFVTKGVPGVSHRLFLIEAETQTLDSKLSTEAVKSAFDKAISSSNRTGFIQDCAIANERCGDYFLRQNDVEWAEHYLTRAMELYGEWGASEKVKMMKTQYSILGKKSHDLTSKHSSGVRSRERFKADVTDMHCAEVAQILFDPHSSGLGSNFPTNVGRCN